MRKIAIILAALAMLTACKSTKTLLPNVSGILLFLSITTEKFQR